MYSYRSSYYVLVFSSPLLLPPSSSLPPLLLPPPLPPLLLPQRRKRYSKNDKHAKATITKYAKYIEKDSKHMYCYMRSMRMCVRTFICILLFFGLFFLIFDFCFEIALFFAFVLPFWLLYFLDCSVFLTSLFLCLFLWQISFDRPFAAEAAKKIGKNCWFLFKTHRNIEFLFENHKQKQNTEMMTETNMQQWSQNMRNIPKKSRKKNKNTKCYISIYLYIYIYTHILDYVYIYKY